MGIAPTSKRARVEPVDGAASEGIAIDETIDADDRELSAKDKREEAEQSLKGLCSQELKELAAAAASPIDIDAVVTCMVCTHIYRSSTEHRAA